MIRSNPTGIPLRATDVKLLQAEIDKRKAEREAATAEQAGTGGGVSDRTQQTAKAGGAGRPGPDGVTEERRDKQGRSVADRIGL
ncbi:hypothetical protein IAU60_006668 [Kwoniella sp. DSM 27419]